MKVFSQEDLFLPFYRLIPYNNYMSIEAGNILRETREQKGVSIKDASETLHIRIPYLLALENGRAEIIPSAVQARGFLRIYSEYLNLNTNDMLQEWDNPGTTPLSAKSNQAPDAETPGNNPQPVPPIQPIQQNPVPSAAPVNYNARLVQDANTISNPQQPFSNAPQIPVSQPVVPNQPAFSETGIPGTDKTGNADNTEKKPKEQKKIKSKKGGLFSKKTKNDLPKKEHEKSAEDYFNHIGGELSQRRNFLSLSLEDCEGQTLIRSIYLESMENGRFEQLPSLIQARGMLNNYASFLDLDVDAIMLEFATALQYLSEKKNRRDEEKKTKPVRKAGRLKKFFTPDLFVGIFVIVGIAGIIIYSAITITAYRRSISEPMPELSINLLDQYLETTKTPDFLPAISSTPVVQVMATDALFEVNEFPAVESESSEIVSSQPVQLFVNANQRALMRVVSDGKEVFSGRTLPNNTYPFDAENEIELTVSNGDAVSVTYNQQNLGRIGKLGEVMTIIFTSSQAATPTPQFSPTPTNTYEPTYTPQPETPLPTNTPTPYIP